MNNVHYHDSATSQCQVTRKIYSAVKENDRWSRLYAMKTSSHRLRKQGKSIESLVRANGSSLQDVLRKIPSFEPLLFQNC